MKIEMLPRNKLPQLVGLQQELWKFESQFNKEFKVNKSSGRHLIKWLKNMTKNSKSICFVAKENKKIIGFVTGWIYTKQRTLYRHWKIGYGCDVYVQPKFRGRGLGRLLMQKLIGWFKQQGVRYIEIEIYQKNKMSFNLNHSLGFRDHATRLVMELE